MTTKVIGNILSLLAILSFIAFITFIAVSNIPNGKYYRATCSVGNTIIVDEFVFQTRNGGYKRILNNERFFERGICDFVEITPD